MEIDITKVKKIHFVGIKGIAMAALAVYAKEGGFLVTGVDIDEEFPSDDVLKTAKIPVLVGFDASHINSPDLVVYTGAHNGRENIEVQEAIKKNIPGHPHGKPLGLLMTGNRRISVAGSHGKTTTTAMLATILRHARQNPSFAFGCGQVSGLGLPGHFGRGDWFIAEADEYVTDPGHDNTPRFLWQSPEVLVVTNIDYDHPDAYGSLDDVIDAFVRLRNKVNGHGEVILSAEDPNCRRLIWRESSVVLVGFGAADYEIKNIHFSEGRTFFELEMPGVKIGEFTLQVPGRHNTLNAAMAAAAAHDAGISWEDIQKGLETFGGAKRRFENIGTVGTTRFYDDYAHHPSEIAATLSAARAWYPKRRIIAVFQPHTYSRTKALLDEFSGAFLDATMVITTDIYASAREKDTLGISGAILAEKIASRHPNAFFAKDKGAMKKLLDAKIQDGDVVIFMGAGDIGNWGREIIKEI